MKVYLIMRTIDFAGDTVADVYQDEKAADDLVARLNAATRISVEYYVSEWEVS